MINQIFVKEISTSYCILSLHQMYFSPSSGEPSFSHDLSYLSLWPYLLKFYETTTWNLIIHMNLLGHLKQSLSIFVETLTSKAFYSLFGKWKSLGICALRTESYWKTEVKFVFVCLGNIGHLPLIAEVLYRGVFIGRLD